MMEGGSSGGRWRVAWRFALVKGGGEASVVKREGSLWKGSSSIVKVDPFRNEGGSFVKGGSSVVKWGSPFGRWGEGGTLLRLGAASSENWL